MLKKSAIITIIFGVSTMIQLLAQIIITRIFGATLDLDTFLSAVTIPSILVTVIYSTLNNVLVPKMGEFMENEVDVPSLMLRMSAVATVVAIILGFLSGSISTVLYGAGGEDFARHVGSVMQILLIGVPIAVVTTIGGAWYYRHKQLVRFPLAQLFGGIFNIVIIVSLAQSFGIYALVIGFIGNLIVQFFFVIPRMSGAHHRTIPVVPLLLAWIPLIIGETLMRSDMMIIRSYGLFLGEGSLVYLNLISRIFSLAAGVTTIGLQVTILPHLVEYFQKEEVDRAIRTVQKAKIWGFILTSIVILSLLVLGPWAIRLLFEGGKFTASDVNETTRLLPWFILPGMGWGLIGIFFQPLYALKRYKDVAIINTCGFVLAIGSAYFVNWYFDALTAITTGLIALLFTGIIGSEIVWQHHKKILLNTKSQ